jgi:hypothetical protein
MSRIVDTSPLYRFPIPVPELHLGAPCFGSVGVD